MGMGMGMGAMLTRSVEHAGRVLRKGRLLIKSKRKTKHAHATREHGTQLRVSIRFDLA